MRDIRLDRLRTIAIFGIVMIHAFFRTGYFEIVPELSAGWLGGMAVYTLVFPMTNVFVIISSYFLIDGTFRWKKTGELLIKTAVVSLILYLLTVVLGAADLSPMELLECVLSPLVNQYWFISAYIILYILSPYLNKALNALTRRELKCLCLILVLVFSILPTVLIFEPVQSLFDAKNGKGILWFVTIYVLTFYLKRYGSKLLKIKNHVLYLAALGSVLLLIGSNVVLKWVSNLFGMGGDGAARLYFDSSAFVALISFILFILTLKQKQTSKGKFWSGLAQGSLAVYLIHEQPAVKQALWSAVRERMERNPALAFPIVICAGAAVCAVCLAVDGFCRKLRKRVVNRIQ